jgi:hypothetical protein
VTSELGPAGTPAATASPPPPAAAPGGGAAEAFRSHWHLIAACGWSAIWFAILAPRGGIDWKFFTEGASLVFGGQPGPHSPAGGLHTYANYPALQMGPFSYLVAEVLRYLGPDNGVVIGEVLLTLAGMYIVYEIERIALIARPSLTARKNEVRATILIGGAVFLIAWIELAAAFAHLDDGLALLCAVLATRGAVTGRPAMTGVCLALAADAKPWALIFLSVILLLPGSSRWRAAAWALAVLAVAWLPFMIADPATLNAANFTIRNLQRSALRALGVSSPRTPSWDRPAQVILGCGLGVIAIWRRRWPAVLLLAGGARIVLDPAAHSYYTPDVMVGALLWDVLGARRPFPLWSLACFAALNVAPLVFGNPFVQGDIRLGVVIAFTAVLLLAPGRWCWPGKTAVSGASW